MSDYSPPGKPMNPLVGLRFFLLLDAGWRAFIWSFSGTVTAYIVLKYQIWPKHYTGLDDILSRPFRSTYELAQIGVAWVVIYNIVYVLLLALQRAPIPTPREGRYSMTPGKAPNWNIISSCFIAVLSKARYHAPFPGFLVFNIANLPPFVWIMGRVFGPRSKSCYIMDPILLDPHLTTIGRNVTFGYGTIVAGHSQERDTIIISRTVIEDDVLFGGNVIIYGGCKIGKGAVILGGAVVPPFTTIGENELWGGLPARKIKTLPPYERREHTDEAMEELMRAQAAEKSR